MDEILMALIAQDENILLRRDELIGRLDEKVPANLRRDYAAIRTALELNVGEIFAAGSSDRDSARYKALKVLSSSGLSEQRIDFVIKTFSRILGWDKYSEDLEKEFRQLIVRVKKLEDEVSALTTKLKELESNSTENFSATETVPSRKKNSTPDDEPSENFVPYIPAPSTPKSFDFLDKYNALLKLSGREKVFARSKFIKNYVAKAFDCKNFEERMNEPIPPPIFKTINSIFSGAYWAILLTGNQYAVLPNVDAYVYTEDRHKAQAMGEVFNSNFNGVIKKITSAKLPAVFECEGDFWTLKAEGELVLSSFKLMG